MNERPYLIATIIATILSIVVYCYEPEKISVRYLVEDKSPDIDVVNKGRKLTLDRELLLKDEYGNYHETKVTWNTYNDAKVGEFIFLQETPNRKYQLIAFIAMVLLWAAIISSYVVNSLEYEMRKH